MVQTQTGASRSEWLNFIKTCSGHYHQWKASGKKGSPTLQMEEGGAPTTQRFREPRPPVRMKRKTPPLSKLVLDGSGGGVDAARVPPMTERS